MKLDTTPKKMGRPPFSRESYASLNVYFTSQMMQHILKVCHLKGISRSQFIRDAVETHLSKETPP